MLLELHVRNFAVIKDLRAEFGRSFNVLTGETGAGKSLLIDAVLLLMSRGGTDYIRKGEDSAVVEALFVAGDEIRSHIGEAGEDENISLRKLISRNSPARQYINGAYVSQARMREVLMRLLHVYGQSEAKELYDPAYQADLFDLYCDNSAVKGELKAVLKAAREKAGELSSYKELESKRAQEIDYLTYQVNEIKEAGLDRDDEEEVLSTKRAVLMSREKIIRNLGEAYTLVYGDENSAADRLGCAAKLLSDSGSADDTVQESERQIRAAAELVKDAAYTVKGYIESLEAADDNSDDIERRLDLIHKLKKKYGSDISAVKAHCSHAEKRLEELRRYGENESELTGVLERLRRAITDLDKRLSESRAGKTEQFIRAVEKELRDLGMPKVLFDITVTAEKYAQPEDMPLRGSQRLEFRFAAHKGEQPGPVQKIASGGELSRVMLAIKNVIPKEQAITMIFDEVDAGVGGKTAEMLGIKLREIAGKHQVICVTHLPQVAVCASHHLKLEKAEKAGRLETALTAVTGEARVAEITRMLGGDDGSKGAEYARELLERIGWN